MVSAACRVEGALEKICSWINTWPLVHMQVSFGFDLSPRIVQQLHDFPQLAFGFGPIAGQLGLAVTGGALIQRALTRSGIKSSEFFRYDPQPGDLAVASILVGATLAVNILASKLSGGSATAEQIPRSVAEVQSIVALQQPAAVFGAGLASIVAAPWIEERIYRGAILQGLTPYLGTVASVRAHFIILAWLKGRSRVRNRIKV